MKKTTETKHCASPGIQELFPRVIDPQLELDRLRRIKKQALKVRELQLLLEREWSKANLRRSKKEERILDDLLHNQTSLFSLEEIAC